MKTCFATGGSGYVGRNLLRGLHQKGIAVRALARSAESAEIVQALGAMPVRGDMRDMAALTEGMAGADCLFHLAADTAHGPATEAQLKANVDGTKTVLSAARKAGVKRALHLSTEAVLLSGAPLRNASEAMPYPAKFAGGHYLTSTTHIDNAVHGMLLAMEKGQAGEAYFVSDGAPLPFREFVTQMLETQGIKAPGREVPRWLVAAVVRLGSVAARLTGGRITGPMSWQEYATLGDEVTLDISKAKRVLGYEPIITVEQGMQALRG